MTDQEQRIDNAVKAWLADHPGAGAAFERLAFERLADDERREALRRLGYNTPTHLAMFGLS